ncbi:MAG: CRR6 family NdhI maturation factor [Cyanobacteria bacterium P01_A01_bin.105]
MSDAISLTIEHLAQLNLAPAHAALAGLLAQPSLDHPTLKFEIDFPQEPGDPRELSEIPEVRLWFIRLDGQYPWLPLYLDWEVGELARYTAMLVPHQFSPVDGIRYNPEALEIYVMGKVFDIHHWLQLHQLDGLKRLQQMTQMLGYELDDGLFQLL